MTRCSPPSSSAPAAAVPLAAETALHGLRDYGKVQAGQKVLINGASGGVGTYAVQIARALGAEVTGVCNTKDLERVRSIGADHVIDYTRDDFTKGDERCDLILDIAAKSPLSDCRRALTPTGTYVLIGNSGGNLVGGLSRFLRTRLLSPFVSQKMVSFESKPNKESLHVLRELIEAGKVTPVIDRTYPMSEVVDAMSYLGEGHARGKIVITV